jgi:recombinational DNA repair protein RecR
MTLHLVPVAFVTTLTGAVMLRMGLLQGLLRSRTEGRRCASCGHWSEAPVCPNCTRG